MPELIQEHQAVPAPNAVKKQDPEDMGTVKMVQNKFAQLKQERGPISKDWETYERFYKGIQYRNNNINVVQDAPKKIGDNIKVPFNVLQAAIQGIVPIMTDLSPSFEALPQEPGDFELSLIFTDLHNDWWHKYGMQQKLVQWVTDCMVLDGAISKTIWNPDLMHGIGDVEVKIIDPNKFWTNFEATGTQRSQGCKICMEEVTKDVGTWKRLFPEMADVIRPDTPPPKTEQGKESTGLQSPVDQISQFDNQKQVAKRGGDTATGLEMWVDDETMIEIELEERDKNGKPKKALKKKFPKGRHIIILPKQNLLLLDDENPYEGDEFNPYDILKNRVVPRQFWGHGEVRHGIEVQKLFNKMVNDIANYINKTGQPWILNPSGSGIRPNQFTNQLGLILNYNGEQPPKRDFPPNLPSEYFEFVNFMEGFLEGIFGTNELTQGRKPTGITAAEAIEALQEAQQTRIRLKERNMETFLSSMGVKVTRRMMQFYKEPRVVRITGKEGWPSFFEFTLQDEQDDAGSPIQAPNGDQRRTLTKTPFKQMVDPDGREQRELVPDAEAVTQTQPSAGIFDIKVISGTSAPFQKAKRESRAFKLFENNVISDKQLLDAIDWPNAEQAIKEKEARDKELQAMAPPEPPPGG